MEIPEVGERWQPVAGWSLVPKVFFAKKEERANAKKFVVSIAQKNWKIDDN